MAKYLMVSIILLISSVMNCSHVTRLYAQCLYSGTDQEGKYHTVFYDPAAQRSQQEDVIIVQTYSLPQTPLPGGRYVIPTAFASYARIAHKINQYYSTQAFRDFLEAREKRQKVDVHAFWEEVNVMRHARPKVLEERSASQPA